ncbi:hypothetical protein [Pseudomonas sp. CCOS 191]|uniref:hypothetical protein n=1 Tax=Pseudomonas sp. CCOS 191 TaxID=1649877 RepID=UPI000624870F|nr:hypothetical protein [Pseudomonas sp. CCOS 191]CRI56381.1 hypothetical protein CCOS191_1845 [Pseudomonas sp. CCOS 191]
MDTNKMREQFEAWECDAPQGPQTDPMWLMYDAESNAYGLEKIQDRWEVWQASREAVVVELPKVVGFEGAYDSHRDHEFVPSMSDVEDADEIFGLCRRVEAKEVIEAQGLKVAP